MLMQVLFYFAVLAAGVIGGMGMGGGTILIPALVFYAGFAQHTAQAINLIAFVPLAVTALILHIKNKLIDFKKALFCSIFAAAAAVGSSFAAQHVSGAVLAKILGGFLIALALLQIYKLIKSLKSQ